MDFRVGPWTVRPDANSVEAEGEVRHLTPKAMDVLVCLARRRGDVVSKTNLFQEAWPDTFVSDDALTRAIGELRRALNDMARRPTVIETVAKRGYRLVAPVTWSDGGAEPAAQPASGIGGVEGAATQRQPGIGRSRLSSRYIAIIAVAGVIGGFSLAGLNLGWFARRTPNRHSVPVIHKLAVLPFRNASGGAEQDYFAEGVTRSVIAELTRTGSLQVLFRSSAGQYRGARELTEIARESKADVVLQGTVLRMGPRVRVTAQLLPVGGDRPIWSGSFDRVMERVQELEWDMARAVAAEVGAVAAADHTAWPRGREVAPAAYEEFLKGYYFLDRGRYSTARAHFEDSVKEDPRFALAWALLYEADSMMSYQADQPLTDWARHALEQARALDEGLSETHTGLGDIKFFGERDFAGGEAEYRRAVQIDPGSLDASWHYALCMRALGKWDEAAREVQRALQMDPVSVKINGEWMHQLRERHRYEEALDQFRKLIEIEPNSSMAYRSAAMILAGQGRRAESIEANLAADRLSDLSSGQMHELEAAAAAGEAAYWKKQTEMAEQRTPRVGPALLALLHLKAGDRRGAVTLLEAAERVGSTRLIWLNDTEWDPLRSDSRFQAIVRRLNLPRKSAPRRPREPAPFPRTTCAVLRQKHRRPWLAAPDAPE